MLFRFDSMQSILFFSVSILLISFPYRFISTLLISIALPLCAVPFRLQSFRSGQFLFFTCHYCSKSCHIQSIPFLVISRLIFSLSSQRFPLHSFSCLVVSLLCHSFSVHIFCYRLRFISKRGCSSPFRISSVLLNLYHAIPFQSISLHSLLFLRASFQGFSLSVNLQGFRI